MQDGEQTGGISIPLLRTFAGMSLFPSPLQPDPLSQACCLVHLVYDIHRASNSAHHHRSSLPISKAILRRIPRSYHSLSRFLWSTHRHQCIPRRPLAICIFPGPRIRRYCLSLEPRLLCRCLGSQRILVIPPRRCRHNMRLGGH